MWQPLPVVAPVLRLFARFFKVQGSAPTDGAALNPSLLFQITGGDTSYFGAYDFQLPAAVIITGEGERARHDSLDWHDSSFQPLACLPLLKNILMVPEDMLWQHPLSAIGNLKWNKDDNLPRYCTPTTDWASFTEKNRLLTNNYLSIECLLSILGFEEATAFSVTHKGHTTCCVLDTNNTGIFFTSDAGKIDFTAPASARFMSRMQKHSYRRRAYQYTVTAFWQRCTPPPLPATIIHLLLLLRKP